MIELTNKRLLSVSSSKSLVCLFIPCVGNDAEILQIAAAEGGFSVYVFPKHGVKAVSKLSFNHGRLFFDGQPLTAVTLAEGLLKLLARLKPQQQSVLLDHNAKAFEAKHLLKAVSKCGLMDKLSEFVVGFCNTLMAFRELYPGRSCAQMPLTSDHLHCSYNAHNAADDVQLLQKRSLQFIDYPMPSKLPLAWFQGYSKFLNKMNKNLHSLQPLIHGKAVTKGMADKIAASGLTISQLKLASEGSGLQCRWSCQCALGKI